MLNKKLTTFFKIYIETWQFICTWKEKKDSKVIYGSCSHIFMIKLFIHMLLLIFLMIFLSFKFQETLLSPIRRRIRGVSPQSHKNIIRGRTKSGHCVHCGTRKVWAVSRISTNLSNFSCTTVDTMSRDSLLLNNFLMALEWNFFNLALDGQ